MSEWQATAERTRLNGSSPAWRRWGNRRKACSGPWGHKYPFGGYPGPRIPWLQYTVTNWWDRWLKGKNPPPGSDWPKLPVWLSQSKAPSKSLRADEAGKWVAEDGTWASRVKEKVLYLAAGNRLGETAGQATYESAKPLVLDTDMLETSSWGECGNDDLPGDQTRFDKASLYFDSEPLDEDLDSFGYPIVKLTLSVDKPVALLAIRLCELDPDSGASHSSPTGSSISAYRGGDMAKPEKIAPGKDLLLARAPQHRRPHLQEGLAHQALAVAVVLPDAVADRRCADGDAVRRRAPTASSRAPSCCPDARQGPRTRWCKICCRRTR